MSTQAVLNGNKDEGKGNAVQVQSHSLCSALSVPTISIDAEKEISSSTGIDYRIITKENQCRVDENLLWAVHTYL